MTLYKKIIQGSKDSIIYGIGGILSKSIAFFLLPIYTRIFTPAEYGIIEMLTLIIGALGALLVMGMDSAQSFYFFREKENGTYAQAKVISAIIQWRLLWGTVILILTVFFHPLLNNLLFDGKISLKIILLIFFVSFFTQVMMQCADLFRLLYRPWGYILLILGNTILSAVFVLLFVIYFNMDIFGYFLGMLFGVIMCSIFGLLGTREYIYLNRQNFEWWAKLIKFGLPLVPGTLIIWVLNSSDRWFLGKYFESENVGLYAVAAKFSLLVAAAIEIFRKAWWPIVMENIQSKDGPAFFRIISKYFLGISMICIIILTLLSPYLILWFATEEYYSSYPIIGLLSFSSVFYGFLMISMVGVWRAEKSWWMTISLSIAAIINFVFNIFIIPVYGGIGAAVTTSLSMMISNIILLWKSERYWPIKLPYITLLLQIIITVTAVCLILWTYIYGKSVIYSILVGVLSIKIIILITAGRNLKKLKPYIVKKMGG